MRFSVVIPTCNRPEALAACLSRLAPGAQTVAGTNYEVIVTDDGDSTAAQMLVRDTFSWARWTRGPQRGPAANRNHGASLARGDWIAFTDDDCLPDSGWLAAFAMAATRYEAMEGRTTAPGPRVHPLDFSPVNESGGCFWSCNIALSRSCFEAVGGFDEAFPYAAMEDMDLRLRLNARNVSIGFVPAAHVSHPWRRIGDWEAHARRHLQSRVIMETRHPGHGLLPWGRLLIADWHAIRREFLPFSLRHPREGLRLVSPVARMMVLEFWLAFRHRPRRVA